MVGAIPLTLPFHNLRHAHSHLGYFGLLFPLAWLGWGAAGVRIPGRGALWAYGVSTGITTLGFLQGGYGLVAIVGSSVVAGFWLWSALPLLPRMRDLQDLLGLVPIGIVAALVAVPPIALTLRSNPDLAHGLVSTFLSALLFLVIIPSALAGRAVKVAPWPVFLVAGAAGALFLGVAPNGVTRAAFLGFAGLMLRPALADALEPHLRAVWALVSLGLAAMALGLIPNIRPVALGATHFLILGPVLGTLAPLWLPRPPSDRMWWLGHAAWGAMSAGLVFQAWVTAPWTWQLAAAGGTGTVLWWGWVLATQRHPADGDRP
jgi:hypothetical protein